MLINIAFYEMFPFAKDFCYLDVGCDNTGRGKGQVLESFCFFPGFHI